MGRLEPAISVAMPLHNDEKHVGEAIASLKRQTFGDFEVLMVDDGSTDRTLERVRELTGDDARFRIWHQENAGPATARNRALAQAGGRYVAFLDADDWFADDAFARLFERAEADGLDYLDFNAHTIYEDESLRAVRDESFYEGRRDIEGVMSGPELFCAFQRNREYVCALWLHFVRRSLLAESGLRLRDGMYVHEDELFSPLLIAHAKRAAFMNEPLYQRRVRAGSAMTAGRGMRNVVSMYEVSCELLEWTRGHAGEYDGAFRSAMAQRIAELRELACADAELVSADELVAYSESLPAEAQLDFELVIVQGALRRSEFYGSTTWRIGEAILRIPNAIRKMCIWGQTPNTHFR